MKVRCEYCNGEGVVPALYSEDHTCPHCKGAGYFELDTEVIFEMVSWYWAHGEESYDQETINDLYDKLKLIYEDEQNSRLSK